MEFAEDLIAAFDKFIWEPEEFFEGCDQIVVYVKVRSRPKGGSVDMEARNGHLWTIRDGTILSMKSFAARRGGPRSRRAAEVASFCPVEALPQR